MSQLQILNSIYYKNNRNVGKKKYDKKNNVRFVSKRKI